MKWFKRYIGLMLMVVGVGLLLTLHLLHLTFANILLLIPLCIILIGFFLHVHAMKKQ